jgi:SnoaL-like domain
MPMWSPERAVLEANLSFYEAFAAQDLTAMDRVWSRRHPVACIHPGWQVLRGRERVIASWRAILEVETPSVRCEDARAHILDEAAFVTCVELVGASRLVATNIFVFEEGVWRMVHHQASPYATRNVPGEVIPPKETLN